MAKAKTKPEYVYIKNNRKYAVSYVLTAENGLERTIKFPCFLQYRDTGNVYSTGITEVTKEDFEELKKGRMFQEALENGWLVETDEGAINASEKSANALAEENASLKEKIAKLEAEGGVDNSEAEEKAKALAEENASLKAELEALKANKTESNGETF